MRSVLLAVLASVAAWAATPPVTEAQLEDALAWERRARVLLDGPGGCVQVQGAVRYELVLYTPGGWLGPGEQRSLSRSGTFEGTLDHGVWTRLETHLDPVASGDSFTIDQVRPMVGKLPKSDEKGRISVGSSNHGTVVDVAGGAQQGLGLLDQVLASIDPETAVSWASWDDAGGAVVLQQGVPVEEGGDDLVITTRFPGGGDPTTLDAIFPPKFAVGKRIGRVSLMNAQLHLRSRPTPLGVLPGEESASFVAGVFGWTVGFEQRLVYQRARGCL